ncbi:hypothetical protein RA19_02425 [Leisingera sp. ANG-M1]|uniref:hypothetical protein n=1 Tax=Leisingera sp. ANG-M1 TaxID=1577895 RepID=UPI00057D704F|nr:hypothetical protein [Leisingera sp. ANG-M1]KIC12126.1 hypothetical protein RA19_02425 [Leisingera sp. ANG-M1]
MGLKKAVGIVVFCIQGVIGADYYFQTRDAGLGWGQLSSADYAAIVRERITRVRAERAGLNAGAENSVWGEAASYGKRLLSGGQQVAEAQEPEAPKPICVRRGNVSDC